MLGEGAYASVQTCFNRFTEVEYAVKIIDKVPGHSRARVFKEIELFHHSLGHRNIIQLVEYFEQPDKFFLVFEKVSGGQLLDYIQTRYSSLSLVPFIWEASEYGYIFHLKYPPFNRVIRNVLKNSPITFFPPTMKVK